jgi:hypothetical protein
MPRVLLVGAAGTAGGTCAAGAGALDGGATVVAGCAGTGAAAVEAVDVPVSALTEAEAGAPGAGLSLGGEEAGRLSTGSGTAGPGKPAASGNDDGGWEAGSPAARKSGSLPV